ncbi:MAG: 5-carboxymethyl-2-hydroxymuconate Delta-isomerase [Pontibacterium sp.]
MPHCIIEYSKEIEAQFAPSVLIEAVYQAALESELFDGPDIKVRALAYTNHQSGGRKSDFVHVSLRILSGRNEAQRKHLSQSVLAHLRLLKLKEISLTVEVLDIDRSSYAKHVE